MKNVLFIESGYGVNKVIKDNKVLDSIKGVEWEEVSVESKIVSKYEMFDSIGRIEYDNKFSIEEKSKSSEKTIWDELKKVKFKNN
jgi:copper chaperone CopZ